MRKTKMRFAPSNVMSEQILARSCLRPCAVFAAHPASMDNKATLQGIHGSEAILNGQHGWIRTPRECHAVG
jgi:hypothetical protein